MFIDPRQQFPGLTAKEMIIEQDATSMGIDYLGGGYRDLTWGERERGRFDIDAGWDEDARLVVHVAGDDIDYHEIWELSEDGERLTLLIKLSGKQVNTVEIVRSYDRKSDA